MSTSIAWYDNFLLNNVSTISTLESSLRSLTWLLPGRFKDAELASESLSASLNVMSMYHDTLLAKIVQSDPQYRPLIPTSLHTRFTRAWSDKEGLYKWVARTLELLRFTELVVEMGLRRKASPKTKWRTILLIEILKTFLRFSLLQITRRPVLSPPIPERDFDLGTIPPPSSPSPAPSSHSASENPDHLRNNLSPVPPHSLLVSSPSNSTVQDFLLPKALTPTSVKPSTALVKTLSGPQEWVSEILYILRPLVYVSFILLDRRKSKTITSRPLIAALVLELLSHALRRNAPPSASLEREEYARRDRDLLWYLLRGPIWTGYTRPKVEGLVDRLAGVPIMGLFGAVIKDWIPLIDEYYYYTAP